MSMIYAATPAARPASSALPAVCQACGCETRLDRTLGYRCHRCGVKFSSYSFPTL